MVKKAAQVKAGSAGCDVKPDLSLRSVIFDPVIPPGLTGYIIINVAFQSKEI
jgi:hypothetical protein